MAGMGWDGLHQFRGRDRTMWSDSGATVAGLATQSGPSHWKVPGPVGSGGPGLASRHRAPPGGPLERPNAASATSPALSYSVVEPAAGGSGRSAHSAPPCPFWLLAPAFWHHQRGLTNHLPKCSCKARNIGRLLYVACTSLILPHLSRFVCQDRLESRVFWASLGEFDILKTPS